MMRAFEELDEWPASPAAAGAIDQHGNRFTSHGADTVFPLASVTKALSALVVLVAVEEGLIELDMPAGPPRSTLRHLLAHASGLAPDQRRLMTEPGTRRIYSNAGYEVLADLVAVQADMAFEEYFHEALVVPLGLTATSLTGSAAHGASSCVTDLLIVPEAVLRPDGHLLDPSTIAEMCAPTFADLPGILPGYGLQDPNSWGLGLEIRGNKSPHWTGSKNSPRTVGHFGRSGSFLWVDLDRGIGAVSLADLEFGEWSRENWPTLSDSIIDELS